MREMEALGSELKRSQDALAESREEVSDGEMLLSSIICDDKSFRLDFLPLHLHPNDQSKFGGTFSCNLFIYLF